MAEFTNVAPQTVLENQNVLFSETSVCGGRGILHRLGSGLITLRGVTSQCRAQYRISFGANIAIPTGGTVGPISLAISIDGEPLGSATAIVTPAAVEDLWHVHVETPVDVPTCTSVTVTVRNTSDQAILVQNVRMSVLRTA